MKKALVLFLFLQLLTTLAFAQEEKPTNKTVGSDEKLAAGLQKNAHSLFLVRCVLNYKPL